MADNENNSQYNENTNSYTSKYYAHEIEAILDEVTQTRYTNQEIHNGVYAIFNPPQETGNE